MTILKAMLLAGAAGHLLCGYTDCLLTYLPGGRFRFEQMRDNNALSETFRGMPLERALRSMLLGCTAMCLMLFGYLALCLWMRRYSRPCAALMLLGCALFTTFGMAHHILCGVPEWLYVKLGRTEAARQLIDELFRRTAVTMVVCYAGFLVFGAALLFAVATGLTPLPRWAWVFNVLPLMLALLPARVGGSGNWAGAIMFLGLLFML